MIRIYVIILVCAMLGCQENEIATDLSGSIWKVMSIKELGDDEAEESPNMYTLDFTSDSRYTLQLDVNKCGGEYSIIGNGKIVIQIPGCTKVGGDSDYALALMKLLGEMTNYSLVGDALMLNGNGEIELRRL